MATLIVGYGTLTEAQDPAQVCGNSAKETVEQCDDGNLKNGDGCSSQCTVEKCGNGIVDSASGEQCDGGQGCNTRCQVEFCGDGSIQYSLREQCDDGNGITGDGCSASCQNEDVTPPSKTLEPKETPTPHPAAPAPIHSPVVSRTVVPSSFSDFFVPGNVFLQRQPESAQSELQTIIRKAILGRITQKEKESALAILQNIKTRLQTDRETTTTLLKQLTQESTEYFVALGADLTKLQSVDPTIVLAEVERIAPELSMEDIALKAVALHASLADLGLDIPSASSDETTLTSLDTFQSLVDALRTVRNQKTKDIDRSMQTLHDVEGLRGALRTFEADHSLDPVLSKNLTDTIERIARTEKPSDIVTEERSFVRSLTDAGLIHQSDLGSASHAAATEDRPTVTMVASLATSPIALEELADKAPEQSARAFKTGTTAEQAQALLQFLTLDPTTNQLRSQLTGEQSASFDTRFETLTRALKDIAAGKPLSLPEALASSDRILSDLQAAVLAEDSLFDSAVHSLQRYFNK